MQCPECKGTKIVLVPQGEGAAMAMGCPTCNGVGAIPDPPEPPQFPDNCLSCGTPIAAGKKWCDAHGAADLF